MSFQFQLGPKAPCGLVALAYHGDISIFRSSPRRGSSETDSSTMGECWKTLYTTKFFSYPGSSVMFKTGDIVQWREDGSLEKFGRLDDQVKIQGFRVELDGVTAVVEVRTGTPPRVYMLTGRRNSRA